MSGLLRFVLDPVGALVTVPVIITVLWIAGLLWWGRDQGHPHD
jgi:hypothetical protein